MIIFINGAFGVGKTTTASLLEERIENAMIFDPEQVGMMLRSIIPFKWQSDHENTGDFQDFDLWRTLTVKVIGEFKERYNCHLIIPMTIRKLEYFEYIYNGVSEFDKEVYHFCLEASKETVHKRLVNRGDALDSWAFHQTDKCIEGFAALSNKMILSNEEDSAEEVVARVLEIIGYNAL